MPIKFTSQRILVTTNCAQNVNAEDIEYCIAEHHSGNWGNVDPETAARNEQVLLKGGGPLWSVYTRAGKTIWVKTEAVNPITTVLLPEDY